jgi:hypothetical protein
MAHQALALDLDLNELTFKKVRTIIPFKCKMTGKFIWPGKRIYVANRFRRDPEVSSTLIIERIRMSDAEYMMHTLTKKDSKTFSGEDTGPA